MGEGSVYLLGSIYSPTRTVSTEFAGITISAYFPATCNLHEIAFFVVFSNCTLSSPSPLMVAQACRSSVPSFSWSTPPNTRRVQTALSPGLIVRLELRQDVVDGGVVPIHAERPDRGAYPIQP